MTRLDIYVVFRDTLDFPGQYVLRVQTVGPHGVDHGCPPLAIADSLAEIHRALPPGVSLMPTYTEDEILRVVETWV